MEANRKDLTAEEIAALRSSKVAIEKKAKPWVVEEPPKELNEDNVIYWSTTYQKLMGLGDRPIATKAHRFLKEKCVKYNPDKKAFEVKPIKGYNKTTYTVKPTNDEIGFKCNCQYHTKTKKVCSHILAVRLSLKIKNWNKKNE